MLESQVTSQVTYSTSHYNICIYWIYKGKSPFRDHLQVLHLILTH